MSSSNEIPNVLPAGRLRPRTDNTKPRRRHTHIFARDPYDFYIEPHWCSERLFEVEDFIGPILDPCVGSGRIANAALAAGYGAITADIVNRGYPRCRVQNFLDRQSVPPSVVTNPPFDIVEQIVAHALQLGALKVAVITPVATLNAARWAFAAPLRRIWLLSPRPPMPPGDLILAGMKPDGGRPDYVWLVFERHYRGKAEIARLHRDGDRS